MMIERLRTLRSAARPILAAAIALVLTANVVVATTRGDREPSEPQALPTTSAAPTPSATPTQRPTKTATPTTRPVATRSSSPRAAKSAGCGTRSDFNGDGYEDLAIGVPGFDVDRAKDAGAVQVLFGGRSGLSASKNQRITQSMLKLNGGSEEGDRFGTSFAGGDFNGDGYADLAVGVPFEDSANLDDGAVNIIYGSRSGLNTKRVATFGQDTPGMKEEAALNDQFGYALAAGDFDRDGYADLAIGVPFEDLQRPGYLEATGSAGAINILFGSKSGLSVKGNALISQNMLGLDDVSDGNDLFGWSLTSSDFNGDGFCDLAAGAPRQRYKGVTDAGSVNIILGSTSGLGPKGAQFWTQGSPGLADQPNDGDQFGYSIASGDMNGDGYGDLAVGVFNETVDEKSSAGAVQVLYGSKSALTSKKNQLWTQNSAGMLDTSESGDEMGFALAAGDLNGDGIDDLAVGVAYEGITTTTVTGSTTAAGAGAVVVIYGTRGGLSSKNNQFWHQDSPDLEDTAEAGDLFGFSVAIGDFSKDRAGDLAVGVAHEGFANDQPNAGAVQVIPGIRGSGVRASGAQFWHAGADGLPGAPHDSDFFGTNLT